MGIRDMLRMLAGTGTQCVFCGREIAKGQLMCKDCGIAEQEARAPDCRAGGVLHVYRYDGPVRKLIHSMKYNDMPRYSMFAAQKMYELAEEQGIVADIVTFVPIHTSRLRRRGYDQSELIAADLSVLLGIPCRKLLQRTRATKAQFSLNAQERSENIAGAFALDTAFDIDGKTILLIDDIYTSGATMGECASLLAPHARVVPFAFSKDY